MFVVPFTKPSPSSVGRRFFSRWAPWKAQPLAWGALSQPLQAEQGATIEEDAIPDLAQRVREAGEW